MEKQRFSGKMKNNSRQRWPKASGEMSNQPGKLPYAEIIRQQNNIMQNHLDWILWQYKVLWEPIIQLFSGVQNVGFKKQKIYLILKWNKIKYKFNLKWNPCWNSEK